MMKHPLLLLTTLLLVLPFAQSAEPARPNVILCMTDDQGWGDVIPSA